MTLSPLLVGKKVRLTAFSKDDLPAMRVWYQNADFIRRLEGQSAAPKTHTDLESWLDSNQKDPHDFLFAVRRLEDDSLLGLVHLNGILLNQQVGWLAIGLGDSAERGKGYGEEALTLLIDFAFRELNLRRVQLTVFGYNKPAIALYEKLGFQREGAFREFLHRDGQLFDMFLYGLLRREWENHV